MHNLNIIYDADNSLISPNMTFTNVFANVILYPSRYEQSCRVGNSGTGRAIFHRNRKTREDVGLSYSRDVTAKAKQYVLKRCTVRKTTSAFS